MIDLHIPALMRKLGYSLSGKLLLSDAVRNFAYQWAWSVLRTLPKGSRICDIGSRSSLFPAFLAWRGFKVDIVEKDNRFIDVQKRVARSWNVRYGVHEADFLIFDPPEKFNVISSLFSLQHAGENDVPAYGKAAALLAPGGMFLSACEYDDRATRWHEGRDDGAMRIYGPQDIAHRMETSLVSGGMDIVERKYAGFTKSGRGVEWREDPEGSAFFFLCARKK
jgi:SAM-dependent methyltransferase